MDTTTPRAPTTPATERDPLTATPVLYPTPDGDFVCGACGALVRFPVQHKRFHALLASRTAQR